MTEICTDVALGVTTQILWLVILIESLFTESLMESWIKPQGVFFVIGILSFVATILEYLFVAETKGLEEREKKELYMVGGPYGRKPRADDIVSVPRSPAHSVYTELSR